MSPHAGGGGPALQSGASYQNRVAAWLAVQILAEAEVSAPWDLPSKVTLDSIRCEVDLPVDDILVGNSAGGHSYVQAKHSVSLESSAQSDLASAFDQFVRLYLESKRSEGLSDPAKDPLSIAQDRLVLAVGELAADLIVGLVGRYLAEYRHILREDRECREGLTEILDTFVQWPNARRLTYRLDEIFR